MGIVQDLHFALRTLFRSKMVAIVAIASLALIIAGNTVVFSVVNSLLIRPLDFDPEARLMLVWRKEVARTFDRRALSPADFVDYRDKNRVFEELAGYRGDSRNLTGAGDPEALGVAEVSPSFFRVVKVSLALGRSFTEEEGLPGGEAVAVLSHSFFESRFGGDRGVLGRSIELDRKPFEVVGVLEEGFQFLDAGLDVYLPLAVDPATIDRDDATIWPAIGKRRPDVSLKQAREDLAAIAAELERSFPDANRGIGVEAMPFRDFMPGPEDRKLFRTMQGAGIFLLLIACANLANLLLARGQVRQRELALRSAIGASRWRIVRQLLTESVVLAMTGGLVGIGLGLVGVRMVRNALGSDIPQLFLPVVDSRVLLYSLAISAAAGLVFGTFPALRSTSGALVEKLKEGVRGNASASRGWLRKSLVVTQVALALVLLCGIALLLKSFLEAQHTDPGFDDERLLTFRLTLPEAQYDGPEKRNAFFESLLPELQALPGVESATLASALPRTYQNAVTEVEVEDQPIAEGEPRPQATSLTVVPGYFEAMSIPLLRGRDFTLADNADAAQVAIVDRRFAERFWPGEDPVGKTVVVGEVERRVVAMAKSVNQRRLAKFSGPLNSMVYVPWTQDEERRTARFLVRAAGGDPMALADSARAAVWSYDRDLPVAELREYDDVLATVYVGITVFGNLLGGFGAVALLLAALGVYGVLAYSVTQRTQEIGVRVALGASRGNMLGMVMRDGAGLAAVGVVIALPLVYVVRQGLESVIEGMTAGWLIFLPIVTVGLFAVILAASLAPALRAANLSPTDALRAE